MPFFIRQHLSQVYFAVWNNIQDEIIGHVQTAQNNRLVEYLTSRCESFQRVYRTWHAKQPDKSILPRAIDLMFHPGARAFIERDDQRGVIDEKDFAVYTEHFPQWAADWKATCDQKLRDLVRNSPSFQEHTVDGGDPLWFARIVFTCRRCEKMSSGTGPAKIPPLYPAILTHDCLYADANDAGIKDPFERAAVSVSRKSCMVDKHTIWSCDLLEIHPRWARRMEKIIRVFSKDPTTVTRDEMDAVTSRVYCVKCEEDLPLFRDVMSWRHVVSHRQYVNSKLELGKLFSDQALRNSRCASKRASSRLRPTACYSPRIANGTAKCTTNGSGQCLLYRK